MKVSEADRNRFPCGGPLPGHSLGKSSLSQNDPLLRQSGVQSIEQGQMRILCARPPVLPWEPVKNRFVENCDNRWQNSWLYDFPRLKIVT